MDNYSYSICLIGEREPTQLFQGNRDIPITSQPQFNDNQCLQIGPDQQISKHYPAIGYLNTIDKVFIQKNISLDEILTGSKANSKYTILNPRGESIFIALEESGSCIRMMCESIRNFEMHIFDNLNNGVIRMYRHQAFFSQKLEIFCPTDVLVGFVRQEFTLFHPKFGIFDRDGTKVLQVEGPICDDLFEDVNYRIKSLTGKTIGKISKQWMGYLQDVFTTASFFRLEFPLDLDVNMKMSLLGAAFLIDFMYYDTTKC